MLADTLVWDNHACMPLRPDDTSFLPQLQRHRATGVDVVCLNAGFGPQPLDLHVRMLASMRRWIEAHSDDYALASSIVDIEAARASGRLAILFDVEGYGPLDEGDHGVVAMFHDLGVRWMLVAYNRGNRSGAGCYDDHDEGLTAHGRAILTEMRRVGIIACCSHTGHRTARELIDAAGMPVIFSHSNCAAIDPHPRNISDELIRACAATDGVIGITGVDWFLGGGGVERMVQHIDHVVQVAGIRHVGLSTDLSFDQAELMEYLQGMRSTYPGIASLPPPRFLPPELLPAIFAGLLDLGYEDADLAAIAGGNWARVAAAVWQ